MLDRLNSNPTAEPYDEYRPDPPHLLHLAGASSFAAAAAAAARAEGSGSGGGPTFASRTPMRVGMVTLRVRKLDPVADFYRDVLGLTVMERSATGASSAPAA